MWFHSKSYYITLIYEINYYNVLYNTLSVDTAGDQAEKTGNINGIPFSSQGYTSGTNIERIYTRIKLWFSIFSDCAILKWNGFLPNTIWL